MSSKDTSHYLIWWYPRIKLNLFTADIIIFTIIKYMYMFVSKINTINNNRTSCHIYVKVILWTYERQLMRVCYGVGVMGSGTLFNRDVRANIMRLRIDFSLSRNLMMIGWSGSGAFTAVISAYGGFSFERQLVGFAAASSRCGWYGKCWNGMIFYFSGSKFINAAEYIFEGFTSFIIVGCVISIRVCTFSGFLPFL